MVMLKYNNDFKKRQFIGPLSSVQRLRTKMCTVTKKYKNQDKFYQ